MLKKQCSYKGIVQLISLVFILLVSFKPCFSQKKSKDDTAWLVTDEGCKVYNHIPSLFKRGKWSGECKNGKLHGEGEIAYYYENDQIGYKYIGNFVEGYPHGKGQSLYYRGSVSYRSIKGSFEKSYILTGYIEEIHYNRDNSYSLYEGESENGRKNGNGKYTHYDKNGRVIITYKGNFVNDKKEGNGEEKNQKNSYKGGWKGNIKEGKGILFYENKKIYEGELSNNKPHGRGIRYYQDGGVFSGEFKKGFMHGFGIRKWANGAIYYGSFKEGKFEGNGFIEKNNTITQAGLWIEGSLNQEKNKKKIRDRIFSTYSEEINEFQSIQE